MRTRNVVLALVATLFAGFLHTEATPAVPHAAPDPSLKRAVDAAVTPFLAEGDLPGAAVGIVTPDGCFFFNYGFADDEKTPVTENTLFEVGSISKTFTATLAALAAVQGRLSLGDPVAVHLPEYRSCPLGDVTLVELATQTSGLPFLAPDEVDEEKEMTAWLAAWRLEQTPETLRIYSNPGIGVLGRAAARSLGMEYTTAAETLLFAPLGMHHTCFTVPQSEMQHYAMGHLEDGTPWRMQQGIFWAEAYGVRTSASDLVLYMQAQMGMVKTPPELASALETTHKGYSRAGPLMQALVWDEFPFSDRDGITLGNSRQFVVGAIPANAVKDPKLPADGVLIGKTGATYGFGSYVAFLPSKKIGVVILANKTNSIDARVRTGLAVLDVLLALPHSSALTGARTH
jgi:beta-lactamase class C